MAHIPTVAAMLTSTATATATVTATAMLSSEEMSLPAGAAAATAASLLRAMFAKSKRFSKSTVVWLALLAPVLLPETTDKTLLTLQKNTNTKHTYIHKHTHTRPHKHTHTHTQAHKVNEKVSEK